VGAEWAPVWSTHASKMRLFLLFFIPRAWCSFMEHASSLQRSSSQYMCQRARKYSPCISSALRHIEKMSQIKVIEQWKINIINNFQSAGHSSRAVWGMNCLLSHGRWDRGFKSYLRHSCLCMRLFCFCVVLCLGSGLTTSWSLAQGVLPPVKNDYGTE
jgi:hypothetical protein